MKEEFRDISEYEGLYQVSNYGRVKGLERKVYAGRGRERIQKEKFFSNNRNNGNGYKVVSLSKNNIYKNYYIHRLVAETFIPNPDNLPQVNHIDENKANNNVNNLEWCNSKYNNNYNNKPKKIGFKLMNNEKNSKKIYQLNDKDEIINIFPSISEASRQMNVSYQAISDCLNGKQKHSANYKWKYVDEKLQ